MSVDPGTSPAMRQYLDAKSAHPDCLILFRIGDFYEVFYEDAVLIARELELTLTSRQKEKGEPIPMAGVPHHSSRQYIRRLIEKGYRVAICEQLEDPSRAKGIVRRGVVRVVTPGVLLEDDALEARRNNFLAALAAGQSRQSEGFALCAVDVSTGEFAVAELLSLPQVEAELRRLGVREVLISEGQRALLASHVGGTGAAVTVRPDTAMELGRSLERATRNPLATPADAPGVALLGTTEVRARLAGLDAESFRDRAAVDAAIALIVDYLVATQGGVPASLGIPSVRRSGDHVVLDPATVANLEIFETLMGGKKRGSLLSVLDETVTAAGGRRLRTWLAYPLARAGAIRARQNSVTVLRDRASIRSRVRESLRGTADVQRVCARLAAAQGGPRDLVALRTTLGLLPELIAFVHEGEEAGLSACASRIDPCGDLRELIGAAIVDEPPIAVSEGGVIRRGWSPALDELLDIESNGKEWLARYEAGERERTQIPSLKVRFNNVFGYYIEVTRTHLERVPSDYIRKQTISNGERFFTAELKEWEDRIVHADERKRAIEARIFEEVRGTVMEALGRLRETADALAELDGLAALAELSHRNDWAAPEIAEDPGIDIRDGRHPVVERLVEGQRFVPNDTVLNPDARLMLVTGPNMAGKSTVIRQAALIVLLAQIGSHVPASSARVGVVDQIFSRVGASDNLARGHSTFMVEMIEVAHILSHATARSLIILDEIGRGTSTWDGLSIAWATAEHLHDRIGALTMFATHYHELTDLARSRSGVRNCNIAVREWQDEVVFLHRLVEGPASRSYGIQVARLAGLPEPVIARAREVLGNLEASEFDAEEQPMLARRAGVRKSARREGQLSLFAPPEPEPARPAAVPPAPVSAAAAELASAALDAMTPIEAMNLLYRLQKRAREELTQRQ